MATHTISNFLPIEEIRKLRSDDPLIRSELQAREKWAEYFAADPLITKVVYSNPVTDYWNPADCYILSGGTRALVEVKSRSGRANRYSDVWLESSKLLQFKAIIKTRDIVPIHMSLFDQESTALVWRMDAHNKGIRSHFAPRSTNGKDFTPKEKEFLTYDVKDAHRIELDDPTSYIF